MRLEVWYISVRQHTVTGIVRFWAVSLFSPVQSLTFESAGSAPLATTGFPLAPSESRTLDAPVPWSGRLWGRTICAADPASGRFSCATGDCGSGSVECSGGGAAPPATLAEFTLGGSGGSDFYDVSLVDGSNVPMLVVPQSGSPGGSCGPTGCLVDLNGLCPAELRVAQPGGETAACRSACEAFRTARYCCSGEFGSPGTCGPTAYSQFFKNACPRAYSYAYDDATSTFTCPTAATAGYTVTFCPSTTRRPAADQQHDAPAVELDESRWSATEPRPPLLCGRGGAAAAPPALNLSPHHIQGTRSACDHARERHAVLGHCSAGRHLLPLLTRRTVRSHADIFELWKSGGDDAHSQVLY
ncbi:hypothetical protein B296_00033726 [Ensete ventricosum]|uniref:Thaumatin-like protein n=1 Tax=Ensete ventricosum TaxID=4639 RepID=A0A426YAN8_ENSVE|nr:hypothetical protein B296_00033726 [Ensete ventricosum]